MSARKQPQATADSAVMDNRKRLAAGYTPPAALEDYMEPAARAALARGEPIAFMLAGPAGSGKTEAAYWLADKIGLPLTVVDCSLVREPRDFMGTRDIRPDGTTGWNDSHFTRAVVGGSTVVLLDEINRATPATLNALLPLLDRRGSASLQERPEPLIAGPSIVWLATRNEGAEYTGTQRSDRALLDRFPRTVRLDYLTPTQEAAVLISRTGLDATKAQKIARFAEATRKDAKSCAPLSPRASIALAQDLAAGLETADALDAIVAAILDPDARNATKRLAVAAGL